MKVSIITSCFNREATIGQAIESVLAQDYPDIEYIVVDGASTDRSLEIINRYKDRINRIISEPDKGMYEAINKGIRAATGDIIGLLHSDDFLFASDTISQIAEAFKKTNADFVYGNGIFVDAVNTQKVIRNWISGHYGKWKVHHGWLPLHPTCYIRKECFTKYGFYNENYKIAADSDLLVRLLYEKNLKVVYLNKYIVRMRMGGLSTNPSRMRKMWKEDIRMYRSHGFPPTLTKLQKMAWKVPQFITPRMRFPLRMRAPLRMRVSLRKIGLF